jgi:hypothetical protein
MDDPKDNVGVANPKRGPQVINPHWYGQCISQRGCRKTSAVAKFPLKAVVPYGVDEFRIDAALPLVRLHQIHAVWLIRVCTTAASH